MFTVCNFGRSMELRCMSLAVSGHADVAKAVARLVAARLFAMHAQMKFGLQVRDSFLSGCKYFRQDLNLCTVALRVRMS